MATDVPRNATQLVELICNTFGIDLLEGARDDVPAWKVKAVEAGKFNRAMKRNPQLTLEHLALAVDYCHRNGIDITKPYAVIYHVDKARAEQLKAERAARRVTPAAASAALGTTVQNAIDVELRRADDGDMESDYWIGRLSRASGPAREEVLAEWLTKRG